MSECGLFSYERHVACVLMALLLGLGANSIRARAYSIAEDEPLVGVNVVGAALSKKVFLRMGATVDEVLGQTTIFPDADLLEMDGTRKVRDGEILVVPFSGKRTLFVCGAVREPKVVVVEGEVSAKKILEQIELTDEANAKAFLRRRVFPNGSVVEVKKNTTRMRKTREPNSTN